MPGRVRSKACGCAVQACDIDVLKLLLFEQLRCVMLCYATITLHYATFCSSIRFTLAAPRPFKMKATQAESNPGTQIFSTTESWEILVKFKYSMLILKHSPKA